MRKKLTQLLHCLTDERVNQLFPEATVKVFDKMSKGLPSPKIPVEEARKLVATLELLPPDCRCWTLNHDDAVKLFLVLVVSPKDDSFTFEVGGSTHGRLPRSTMCHPGEEGDRSEFMFRLSRLWKVTGFDQWWYLGQTRTPIDVAAGVPDDPLEVKLADVEPKVEDALRAVKKYAVPYLGDIARKYGVRLVTH